MLKERKREGGREERDVQELKSAGAMVSTAFISVWFPCGVARKTLLMSGCFQICADLPWSPALAVSAGAQRILGTTYVMRRHAWLWLPWVVLERWLAPSVMGKARPFLLKEIHFVPDPPRASRIFPLYSLLKAHWVPFAPRRLRDRIGRSLGKGWGSRVSVAPFIALPSTMSHSLLLNHASQNPLSVSR